MARLQGPFLFAGSLGNIRSFYNKRLKCYIISTKGGASREQIINSPAFVRTRENMSEFSACGKWSSMLRKTLLCIAHLHVGNYFSEIVKMAKEIQLHDVDHPKGTRSIESSKISFLLTTLNFNRDHTFDGVLSAWPEITLSEDKKTVTMRFREFRSFSCLHWRTRFDSYRFALVIAQLPDFVYSEAELTFIPALRDPEQLSVCTFTEWFNANTDSMDICMEASFAEPALQQPGTTVIVAMGIELTSARMRPNDTYSSSNGTMKIMQCFV